MIRRAALALFVIGCSSSSSTPFAPIDGGEETSTPDAGPACKTVFDEDFRDGLGAFTSKASSDGSVAVVDGYLHGSFTGTPATSSFANATATVTLDAPPKALRVFYTSRISKWARDTHATIGCRVALPGGGPEISLELTTRAGPTEDEMRVTLGGEAIESLVGPEERHVVAIVVEPSADGTKGAIDLLWDGVSRKKLQDAPLVPPLDRVELTCGVVAIATPPMASAELPFAGVDDVSVVACP
jgi:hypothetical protein